MSPRFWSGFVWFAVAMTPGLLACSTFTLVRDGSVVLGRNVDDRTPVGRIYVNRRGLEKNSFYASPAARWTSRFGSVTHTQWGLEFPCGGMNEAGLVVENMSLNGTRYPVNSLPAVCELQWIQYQLDCSATVADVVATLDRICITSDSVPLHYMIADRTGRVAIVEFLNGERIVYTDDTLPVAALTNSTYAESLAYEAVTSVAEAATKITTLNRFVLAAAAVRDFTSRGASDPVGYAFATLESVKQPKYTLWSVVHDITHRRVHFRSPSAPEIKTIAFDALDFSCRDTTRTLDINVTEGGNVVPVEAYTRADNLNVLLQVGPANPMTSSVPASYWAQRASYPETLRAIPLPVIDTPPSSQTVLIGQSASFEVFASGEGELTYQWLKDNAPVPGATQTRLSVASVTSGDAGEYVARVVNLAGATTSAPARLTIRNPRPGYLANLSARDEVQPGGDPLMLGFVVRGGTTPLLLRAVGPSLATLFGLSGALTGSVLEVHGKQGNDDLILARNDAWDATDADRLRQMMDQCGAFALPRGSADAALLLDVEGLRTMHVTPTGTAAGGIVLAEAYDCGSGTGGQLVNLSCRSELRTAGAQVIAGFVVGGESPLRLLVRGVGPGLTPFGVHPPSSIRIELHTTRNGTDALLATNERWDSGGDITAAAASVGAFPLTPGSKDAALLLPLTGGGYSAIVSSPDGSTGTVLVELYVIATPAP